MLLSLHTNEAAMTDTAEFTRMGPPISDAEMRRTICWDDGEDRDAALAGGKYVTCAGEWRQRLNTYWQFFKDPTVEI